MEEKEPKREEKVEEGKWKPNILGFLCRWCTYAGADLAGTSRIKYPSNIRIIKVPCSGRINPLMIFKALKDGADGVLVSGCHPGDCHYNEGNYYARRRFIVLRKLLDFVGMPFERVRFSWVSAAEGAKWAQVVKEVVKGVETVGPNEMFNPEKWLPVDFSFSEISPQKEYHYPILGTVDNETCIKQLREVAKGLLESKKVDYIFGYEAGSIDFKTTPLITKKPSDTSRLIINPYCTNNLTKYISDYPSKIGVVVKGCDSRSLVDLLQENQIKRENVVIIALPCGGVIGVERILEKLQIEREDIKNIEIKGQMVDLTINGEKKSLPLKEAVMEKCLDCQLHTAKYADIIIGKPITEVEKDNFSERAVKAFENLPAEKRWGFWLYEMNRCIRCYACRNICPACFCERCFADCNQPEWVSPIPTATNNLLYQLMRIFDVAGRCVNCQECQRVCPMNIPLWLLTTKAEMIVKEYFHHIPGDNPEDIPPLATYNKEDKEDFIL